MSSVLLLFGYVLPSWAVIDTCTWDGSSSADWNTAANWSCSTDGEAVPETGDSLVFPSVASNKSMNHDIAGSPTFNTISVNGDSYNFAGFETQVSNSLVISGNSNTFSGNLEFLNAGSATFQVDGAGNSMSGGMTLTLSAGGDMNFVINDIFTHTDGIFGSTDILQKTGTGSWFTSTAAGSTFTATNININNGTWICRIGSCFGAAANLVKTSSSGAVVSFDTTGITVPNPFSLEANNDDGSLSLDPSVTLTLSGTITTTTSSRIFQNAPSTLNLTGSTMTLAGTLAFVGDGASSDAIVSNMITGTGGLSVTNAEVTLSSNTSDYTGTTTIQSAGVIKLTQPNALGATSGGTTVEADGTLFAGTVADQTYPEPLTLTGDGNTFPAALYNEVGSHTFTGAISISGNTTIGNDTAATDLFLSGVISGTGNLIIDAGDSDADVFLEGTSANTYTGTTQVNGGRLVLDKSASVIAIPGDITITGAVGGINSTLTTSTTEQIANSSNIVVDTAASTATLNIGASETIGSLAGDGTLTLSAALIIAGSASTTFTGAQTGGSGLIYSGTGTFTFSPSSVTAGTFTVNSGTVLVGSDASARTYTVNGGVLGGTGTIGSTTFAGGTLNPGTSPGCVTFDDLTMTSGSTFLVEMDGTTVCTQYDRTTVTGAADLGGATLDLDPTFTPAAGTVFTIFTAGSLTGTFAGLADGATFTDTGLTFRINYTATDVTLTFLSGTLASTGANAWNVIYFALMLIVLAVISGKYLWNARVQTSKK